MNSLGSPLHEALALNYLTCGFLTAVNNIWAWVAVVTAAVSFWRIRTLSSPFVSISEGCSGSQDAELTPPSPSSEAETASVSAPAGENKHLSPATSTTSSWWCVMEGESGTSPKAKFSLYYNNNEDDFAGTDDGSEDGGDGGGGGAVADWERVMVVKMGDMGWYTWQDLKVLDGSVVRLWDGRRRRNAAAEVAELGRY